MNWYLTWMWYPPGRLRISNLFPLHVSNSTGLEASLWMLGRAPLCTSCFPGPLCLGQGRLRYKSQKSIQANISKVGRFNVKAEGFLQGQGWQLCPSFLGAGAGWDWGGLGTMEASLSHTSWLVLSAVTPPLPHSSLCTLALSDSPNTWPHLTGNTVCHLPVQIADSEEKRIEVARPKGRRIEWACWGNGGWAVWGGNSC